MKVFLHQFIFLSDDNDYDGNSWIEEKPDGGNTFYVIMFVCV